MTHGATPANSLKSTCSFCTIQTIRTDTPANSLEATKQPLQHILSPQPNTFQQGLSKCTAQLGLCIGSISASPKACPLRGCGHASIQYDRLEEVVFSDTGTPRRSCWIPARPYPSSGHAVGDAGMLVLVGETGPSPSACKMFQQRRSIVPRKNKTDTAWCQLLRHLRYCRGSRCLGVAFWRLLGCNRVVSMPSPMRGLSLRHHLCGLSKLWGTLRDRPQQQKQHLISAVLHVSSQ